MKNLSLVLIFCLFSGCAFGPLRPGRTSYTSPDGTVITAKQSQNPKSETKQTIKRTQDGNKSTEEINTVIGAAQKDIAREIGAKLASLRWLQILGALVFLFGAATFVYPPLKVIVGGSVTTSAVIALAGLALIVLPLLIVGNELLILGVALGAAVLYWFAHRHASVHATLKTLTK